MPQTLECRRCVTPVPDGALFCPQCGEGVEGKEAGDERTRLRDRLARALGKRYEVGDVLGAGGMGVVFRARDTRTRRRVAIKVLSPELAADAQIVERFGREGRTAAGLKHPGIVPTYAAGDEGGLHYLVMKYVEGRPLDAILHDEQTVTIAFATRVLCEAAGALAHAHRQGVVHRDVKPENIMVDSKGHVLLTDFGISRVINAKGDATTVRKLTQTGGIVGTPHYMAPEHALGYHVDGRTDQYALACVGFQMLAGRLPFDDETLPAILHLHINEAAPPLASLRPDVPPHVAAAIARAMSKSPTNRFDSMEAFATAIAGAPATRPASRRWSWVAAAAVLLVAGASGGALWVTQNGWVLPSKAAQASVSAVSEAPAATLSQPPTPEPVIQPAAAQPTAAQPAATQPAATQPAATQPAAAPPVERATVRLDVRSSPNATLFIDGRRIGVTPILQGRLSVGVHVLRLERGGYRTTRDTITVRESQSIRRAYVMRRRQN
jgi:tRNA A-37 threonylcarbamoyl transferase component Bud32